MQQQQPVGTVTHLPNVAMVDRRSPSHSSPPSFSGYLLPPLADLSFSLKPTKTPTANDTTATATRVVVSFIAGMVFFWMMRTCVSELALKPDWDLGPV